jgi:uncharacterized protein YdeI (YjbR/CyaY-like superfamily)
MSRLDTARAIPIATDAELEAWLAANGGEAREVVVAIHKKSSGKQTVTLEALQEAALCHGWVDTQTKNIALLRYAMRFGPRRPGSRCSPTNRAAARRLLANDRIRPAGLTTLPPDL